MIKKVLVFGCILSLFSIQHLNSQSFSGNWAGNLTVQSDGEDVLLPYKMVIITDGNGNCEGQTALWIGIDGKLYRSLYAFKGTYQGSTLKFSDYKLIESDNPKNIDFYWCEKSGTLYLSGKTLSGNVTGYSPKGPCMPAKASLTWDSEVEK